MYSFKGDADSRINQLHEHMNNLKTKIPWLQESVCLRKLAKKLCDIDHNENLRLELRNKVPKALKYFFQIITGQMLAPVKGLRDFKKIKERIGKIFSDVSACYYYIILVSFYNVQPRS